MTFNERYNKHRAIMSDIENAIESRNKITKAKGLELLQSIITLQTELEGSDYETDHVHADEILLKIIGDKDIEEAFYNIQKWYA